MATDNLKSPRSEATPGHAPSVPPIGTTGSHIEPIYTALVNVRNSELSVYYTRYNIQAVINFGLIAAVLATRQESRFLSPLLPWVVLGGAALSLVWLGFAVVGKPLFTERWEGYLRRYESEILAPQGLPADLRMFTHVADAENGLRACTRNWKNLNILTRLVPVIALAAWMVIGWYAFFVEPLDTKISRLEASVATLQLSQPGSKEIIDRLQVIENQIGEILKVLPPAAATRDEQAQPQPAAKVPRPR